MNHTRDRDLLGPPERDEDRIVTKGDLKKLLERFATLPTTQQLDHQQQGKK